MKTIKQILAVKGDEVYTVDPSTLVVDAVKEMQKNESGL